MEVILFIYERNPYGKNKKIETLLQRMPDGYIVKQVESGEEGHKELDKILEEHGSRIKTVVWSLSIKAPLEVRKWSTLMSADIASSTVLNPDGIEFYIN